VYLSLMEKQLLVQCSRYFARPDNVATWSLGPDGNFEF
jgi:hypothetical protein